MEKGSSFLQKVKRIVMCLAILFVFQAAVLPAPAAAVNVFDPFKQAAQTMTAAWEKVKIAMNNTAIGKIIMATTNFLSTQITKFNEFFDTLTQNGQALLVGQQLQAKVIEETGLYLMDSNTKDIKIQTDMRLMAKLAPPKHEYLCKSILANNLVTSSVFFDKELSRMMAEAISNRYRCPTCNGGGGDYSYTTTKRRETTKVGSPIDYSSSAVDTTKVLDTGETMADADTSGIDIETYEIPIFLRKTYTDAFSSASMSVILPDMTNLSTEQSRFIAKWDYVFHVAGPRPSPVTGNALKTEFGKRQRAMFNHCTANQNALIKQITDWLAYLTRPNYKDSQWDEYRKAQYTKCQAAKGSINMTGSEYGNCDGDFSEFRGLSTFETERLAQEMCLTNQHAMAMILDGSGYGPPAQTNDDCAASYQAWDNYVTLREKSYLEAVEAMQSLSGCWAAVDGSGSSGLHGDASDSQTISPASFVESTSKDAATPIQKVNMSVPVPMMPSGKPISFDEVRLPASIGQ